MRKRNPIMLEEAQERLIKIKMKEETETVWVTEALGIKGESSKTERNRAYLRRHVS